MTEEHKLQNCVGGKNLGDIADIIYHQEGRDSNYRIWHRTHDRMLLLYMHTDGGSIVFNDRIFPIQKGVLCYIGSQKYHYTAPDTTELYTRSKMTITSERFMKLRSLLPDNNTFYQNLSADVAVYAMIPEEEQDLVDQLYRETSDALKHRQHFDAVLLSNYLKLLVYLEKYAVEHAPSSSGFVASAAQYINSHITEDISIDKISAAIHMSKYYFCRRFKEYFGLTVMEYILQTRITMAKNLLRENQIPISEVSEKSGFSSISYFYRVFKEDTGMTPRDYRKRFVFGQKGN